MGISRAKAGLPVDCPTCGLTVRVPHLDGRVDPLPAPGLNLQDSSLANALDQVAMIGQLPPDEVEFEEEPELDPALPARPVPAARPVAIEAPLPPEPAVRIEPAPSVDRAAAEASAAADLASLVRGAVPVPSPSAPPARGARRDVALIGAGVALAAACFAAGFVVGRQSATTSAIAEPAVPSAASPEVRPSAPAGVQPAIRGRITFRTENGDSRPDSGARLIVLPEKKAGEFRLPATGFRAGDTAADVQAAQAALRAMGGDVATVADDGTFEIALPAAGKYNILVLSRFAAQEPGATADNAVRSLLEAWFTRPEQLLGQVRHHLGQCRYSGEAIQLWDHSFERDT